MVTSLARRPAGRSVRDLTRRLPFRVAAHTGAGRWPVPGVLRDAPSRCLNGYLEPRPRSMIIGAVGRGGPAGSTASSMLSPAARPATTLGPIIPARAAGSDPAGLTPAGPLSHSS